MDILVRKGANTVIFRVPCRNNQAAAFRFDDFLEEDMMFQKRIKYENATYVKFGNPDEETVVVAKQEAGRRTILFDMTEEDVEIAKRLV